VAAGLYTDDRGSEMVETNQRAFLGNLASVADGERLGLALALDRTRDLPQIRQTLHSDRQHDRFEHRPQPITRILGLE